jgi:hypothetical protein
MRKLLIFLRSVVDDWVGRMSGSIGLLLGFAAKFWNNDSVPNPWLWAASALALFIAVFRAWLKEYDRAETAGTLDVSSLHQANTLLRNDVDELKSRLRLPASDSSRLAATLNAALTSTSTWKDEFWPLTERLNTANAI